MLVEPGAEDGTTHWIKDAPERIVCDPILQRDVDRVPLPLPLANIVLRPRPREKVAMLVYAAGHDAVGSVEGLLNAIAVVAVDIDVEYPRICAQELEDAEHDVVDVAEPRRFSLFGMVQAAGPVDRNVGRPRG